MPSFNARCTACSLHRYSNSVCIKGRGSLNTAKIMILGEAPGKEEDKLGYPFVGRSGQLLSEILSNIGLNSSSDVYITNPVKCMPIDPETYKIRAPLHEEIEACKKYFIKELYAIVTPIIITLGNTSTKILLGNGIPGINSIRGRVFNYLIDFEPYGIPTSRVFRIHPSYHPSYILRNGKSSELVARLTSDIKSALIHYNSLIFSENQDGPKLQSKMYGMRIT